MRALTILCALVGQTLDLPGFIAAVVAWGILFHLTQRQNHARCRRGEADGVVCPHAVYVNHGRSRNHG